MFIDTCVSMIRPGPDLCGRAACIESESSVTSLVYILLDLNVRI